MMTDTEILDYIEKNWFYKERATPWNPEGYQYSFHDGYVLQGASLREAVEREALGENNDR